jgi:predicted NAD-dependent protein-ADP-ribosyltransferase YbiA (DUF1768 family)
VSTTFGGGDGPVADTAPVVNFYSAGDEFGVFSDFAPFPFALDGDR